MVEAQYRFRRAILRTGETFLVDSEVRRGWVGVLSPPRARMYLSDSVISSVGRPIYAFIVPDDDGTGVSDVIEWQGKSLSVLKVLERVWRGAVLFRVVVGVEV